MSRSISIILRRKFELFLYLGLYFQGLEKEQMEIKPRLDELNQTGQILLEQMGKGENVAF